MRESEYRPYQILLFDPDTDQCIHANSHLLLGRSARDAVTLFRNAYTFKSNWVVRARRKRPAQILSWPKI